MARLSDMARITSRGGRIPDVDDELSYSAYCLYEGVKTEMERADLEVVERNGVKGREGPVSLPMVLEWLWVDMGRKHSEDRDSEAFRARLALYQYLRVTRNLICIKPGNQYNKSIWWCRSQWNDEPPPEPVVLLPKPGSPDRASAAPATRPGLPLSEPEDMTVPDTTVPDTSTSVAGELSCPGCSRTFRSQGWLSSHYYTEHVDFDQLLTSTLAAAGEPQTMDQIASTLRRDHGFFGTNEMIRSHLANLSWISMVTISGTGTSARRYAVAGQAPRLAAALETGLGETAPAAGNGTASVADLPDAADPLLMLDDVISRLRLLVAGLQQARPASAADPTADATTAELVEVNARLAEENGRLAEENGKLREQLRSLMEKLARLI